jgi:uncharacterized coiled-coil protein SlyX
MASQAKVMGSVTQTVRFMIERLQSQIAENRNNFNLNEDQLRSLVNLVETSVQDSYNRSMNQIINTID